jgi:hypothetical protein
VKRRFSRKLSEETRAELERVVELKLKIPAYREIARRDGTSAKYIGQLVSEMLRKRRSETSLVDVTVCST